MPYYKKKARSYGYRKKRVPKKYYSRAKKMVTGQSPTLLENIASGIGSVATIAKAVLPAISAINTEMKYYDKSSNITAYAANDQIVDITTGLGQGTGDSDRIGNSILAKNVQIKMALDFNSDTTGPPPVLGSHCRLLIFCWKENTTSNPPTSAKLFENPSNIYSPVNKDYSDQFVVLKDKFFVQNNITGLSGTQNFMHMKYYKDLNWHIRWADGGDPTQNHVYFCLRSSATASGNGCNLTYYSRMNYTDN